MRCLMIPLPVSDSLTIIQSHLKAIKRKLDAIQDQVDSIQEELEFDEYAGETDDDD